MTTFRITIAALALTALSTAAFAATGCEDVSAAVNSAPDAAAIQPAAGEMLPPAIASADAIAAEKTTMRRLWEDHLSYTRNVIISTLGNLKDLSVVEDRLMKNQDDIGAAITPYYGADAGGKLSALLRAHITVAANVIEAAKSKNQDNLDDAKAKAGGNADDIAAFLAAANPNWNKDALSGMLHKHLDLLTAQVNLRLKKDWKSDIDSYDLDEDQMMVFADMLVDGMAKQFPGKFTTPPAAIQPSAGP